MNDIKGAENGKEIFKFKSVILNQLSFQFKLKEESEEEKIHFSVQAILSVKKRGEER